MQKKMITLPWRAFKAYHQRFCLDTMDTDYLGNNKSVPLFESKASAAVKHVKMLIDNGLMLRKIIPESKFVESFDSKAEEVNYIQKMINEGLIKQYLNRERDRANKSLLRIPTTATYGYERSTTDIIVYPSQGSDKGKAWVHSKGRCIYCGTALTLFKSDGLSKMPAPYNTQAWSCKSCHSTKTGHNIEEMRLLLAMREFEEITGLRFSLDQLEFLEKHAGLKPVDIMIDHYEFYFESAGIPMGRRTESNSEQ
jgi:hypothetical protein